MRNEDYFRNNRELWNGLTAIHERSAFYDVEGFRAGRTSLKPIEIEELGDVAGRRLLHLQCHFGLDTLSWARLGAEVTGVDMSDRAIELARSLSRETGVPARFIESNLYDLPGRLDEEFDIVFTSYGVLCWLPDLPRWAEVVARYVKPGGVFYMVEFHPFLNVLDENGLSMKYSYFHSPEPQVWQAQGSYADRSAEFSHTEYLWTHSLGDVVTALARAGLRIEWLREFPYSVYDCFPFLEEDEPRRYCLKDRRDTVPMMFSLCASRGA